MLCIAVLISAVIAFSAVNDVDNFYDDYVDNLGDDYGSDYVSSSGDFYADDEDYDKPKYDHADNYRWAIGSLLCIASVAIVFHFLMMMIRCLLCFMPSLKSLFKFYAILVSFLDVNT